MLITVGGEQYRTSRVFCIGRNYADHIKELNSERLETPTIFSKPATSLVLPGTGIGIPPHGKDLHHEAEVVVLIGRGGGARGQGRGIGVHQRLVTGARFDTP